MSEQQDQKQSKQRLNIRVRRGLSWVATLLTEIDTDELTAESRRDVEAALRWIAENKQ